MRHSSSVTTTVSIITVALVFVIVGSGSVVVPAHAAPQSTPTHKVIIRSVGEPATYSFTVSGQIVSVPHEQADRARAHQIDGHVGPVDTVDAITYTGYIMAFQANSSTLKATLDGTLLDARLLNANHLQLATHSGDTPSQHPVRYTVVVTQTIVSGEGVEDRDAPTNTTTVTGWLLPGDSDGFYFTGEIVSSTSSLSREASVRVNGQSRSLSSRHKRAHAQSTASNRSTASTQSSSPTSRSASSTHSDTHTLVIDQETGSVGYTVTVSGSISLAHAESSDSITGNSVSGTVGGLPWETNASDTTDVIHYTGEVLIFEYEAEEGSIRVTLDGQTVDPDSLRNTPVPTPSQTASSTPIVVPSSPSPSPTPVPAPSVGPSEPQDSLTVSSSDTPMTSGGAVSFFGLGWLETLVLGLVIALAVAGVGLLASLR